VLGLFHGFVAGWVAAGGHQFVGDVAERALKWIDKYVQESRPLLGTGGADDGTVLLTHMGEPFDRRQLTALVRRHLIESQEGKMGGCHLFRHTVSPFGRISAGGWPL
jgi:site-specific recombinase XerD